MIDLERAWESHRQAEAGRVRSLDAIELEAARRDLAQALAEIGRLTQERKELIAALHDAIRRPMGVVPDSAGQWVTSEGLFQAEERRQQR